MSGILLATLLLCTQATAKPRKSKNTDVIDQIHTVCLYEYSIVPNESNPNSHASSHMILEIGQSHSKFWQADRKKYDSLVNRYKNNVQKILSAYAEMDRSPSHHLADFTVLKNYPNKDSMIFEMLLDETLYRGSEKVNPMTWTLIPGPDTTIANLPCQKATTTYAGRNWTAYYSLQLPLDNGPYKFGGLPGLIVAVHDDENTHAFKLININKNNEPMLYSPKSRYQVYSTKEIRKAIQIQAKQKADRLLADINSGSISFPNPNHEARVRRNVEMKRNDTNFIER